MSKAKKKDCCNEAIKTAKRQKKNEVVCPCCGNVFYENAGKWELQYSDIRTNGGSHGK